MNPVRALRPFVRRTGALRTAEERCELCAAPIPPGHRHLVDLHDRRLCCACPACAILFDSAAAQRYRAVPRRLLHDPDGALAEADLLAAGIPVRLAFLFFHGARQRWIGIYPGPAGSTEAELEEPRGAGLLGLSPLFAAAAPDVEAVLLHGRRGGDQVDALLVPIDRCYELAALVRRHWQGFEGGSEVHRAIDQFTASLRKASRPLDRRQR